MKKILAIILSIAMLFGVLAINTSADTTATPKVTLVTNEGSPVKAGDTTYFTVKFENYDTIKAFDVTITVPEAITIGEITATGLEANGAHKDTNYTVKDNVVRFVDLTTTDNQPKITFAATVAEGTTESPVITVSGEYATSGTNKADFVDGAEGTLEIKKDVVSETVEIPENETSATIKQPEAEAGQEPTQFIPYGSVYKKDEKTGKITYAEKDKNGNFSVTDTGYVVDKFDIPKNGITTYGTSKNIENGSIRFGNYSKNNQSGTKHGTMIFEGDWIALKNLYIQNGYSVQDFVELFYHSFDETLNGKEGFVSYPLNGNKLNLYKFEQHNYMWKDEHNGILEYALRLTNLKPNKTYTAVAYSYTADGEVTISAEVKSFTTDEQ